MTDYKVEPEVAGGLGDDTEIDHSTRPITITKLHYEIEGWLGSELLETTPAFIASDRFVDTVTAAGLTGFVTDVAQVTLSPQAQEYLEASTLPHFQWFKITGRRGRDDFSVDEQGSMIATDRALEVMRPLLGQDVVIEEVG